MKRRILILMAALLSLSACASWALDINPPETPRFTGIPFEVGSVTLISGSSRRNPGVNMSGGVQITEEGGALSFSGIPLEMWLEENLHELRQIEYSSNIYVVVDGYYANIRDNWNDLEYFEEMRIVRLSPEEFLDGVAHVSLPDEQGTYILFVEVTWSGGGDDALTIRYVFMIEK